MRTRKEPEVRRRELLRAAYECFLKNGYEKTLATDIARTAGVAKGTFFYYFPTKEDVLRALAEDEANAVCGRVAAGCDGDAAAQLRTLLRVFGEPIVLDELIDRLTDLEEDRAMRILWEGALPALDDCLTAILSRGMAEGTMHVRDLNAAAAFFWSILDAVWENRAADEAEMQLRQEIGYGLLEELFGMEKGCLDVCVSQRESHANA